MQTEFHDQSALFNWALRERKRLPELRMMFGTLNGVRLTIGQAVKAKSAGNMRGVPDIFLDVPRHGYHGLRIELKAEKGGKVSSEQKIWLENYRLYGYYACVCRGFDAARQTIEKYLEKI